MTRSSRGWGYSLRLANWLGICGAIPFGIALLTVSTNCASAQITPDSTLPNYSIVTSSGNTSTIEGGVRAGNNLFHSFEQFSVPTGNTANFNNALDIQNIISRVTGKSISNIDGLIKANGTANLFLINPNGIIFGPNASLNIGGSFLASTANTIGFGERGFFSASNPESPSSLLTVNPSALLFNQIHAASIENKSVADAGLDPSSIFTAQGLRVPDGNNLLLVGGDININSGGLYAFGGRVELGSLAGAGTVGLNGDDNDLRLSFPQGVKRADMSVNNRSEINVVAQDGGSISINAQNLNISGGSFLLAGIGQELGGVGSQAGDIEIKTTGAVTVAGRSDIRNAAEPGAVGNSGNINITAESLFVTDGAELVASTFGQQGNAGSVTINADTVSFDGVGSDGLPSAAFSSVESGGVGNSGNINIAARALSITDGAQVQTLVRGVSEDGTLLGGQGNAGNVNIDVRDTVSFDGVSSNRFPSAAFSSVESGAIGNAGSINIKAGSLSVKDGARLNASTSGQGNAGSVTVNADTVSFDGVGSNGVPSSALSNVEPNAIGNAGGIKITAGSLLVKNGARVESLTRGQGNAGSVTINADTVSFDKGKSYGQELGAGQGQNRDNPEQGIVQGLYSDGSYRWFSGAYTSVEGTSSKGEGGNIIITTGSLSVTDGAQMSARSVGGGAAGNLEVSARSIRLDNQALLSSDTIAGQGNIFLRSDDLILRRGSNITTNATGTATGGNINIDTDILAALQ
ncbi:MAG TPA: hypothetical protein DEV81_15375, partial [Cyanobacteria bacterium UBA11049]|nr:hypothetical protein [Cyanobacteria bacterium UBA11049]